MKILLFVVAGTMLAGCATPLPSIHTGPDPADATVAVPTPTYAPVTAGTALYRPVESKSWRALNERVAPGSK